MLLADDIHFGFYLEFKKPYCSQWGEVNIMATICAIENIVKEYLLALAHEDDMA